jgi:hypothetical protein
MDNLLLIKDRLLNYSNLEKKNFKELRKVLINKKFVNDIHTFFNNFHKIFNDKKILSNKNIRTFLFSYMIVFHKDEILSKDDVYSDKLYDMTLTMLLNFENLFKKKITLKDYQDFVNNFSMYIEYFKVWKERDAAILIRPSLQSYFFYDESRYSLLSELDELDSDDETHNDKIKLIKEKVDDIEKLQKKIKTNIKIIAGKKGLEYLENREIPVFHDEKIFTDIDKTVRRAYWDVVKENLQNKEKQKEQLIYLLKDLKELLIVIDKKKKKELDELIDIKFLTNVLEKTELTYQVILPYIDYFISNIKKMQAPIDDEDTNIWEENLMNKIKTNENIENILIYFFQIAFKKLEKIKYIMKELGMLNEN